MDERKGFLTPDQEKKLDKVIVLTGVAEKLDGPAITIADNLGLQAAKKKIAEKWGEEVLQDIYGVVDMIVDAIPEPEEV